jgi:hypothetical protein
MKSVSKQFTCSRCDVKVSWMDGSGQAELPDNWTVTDEGTFCLLCRRAIAEEVALDAADEEASPEARAKLRKLALVEFELQRDPERADGEIARACRSSVPAVEKARRELKLPRYQRAS